MVVQWILVPLVEVRILIPQQNRLEVWQRWINAPVLKTGDHRKVVHWFESSSFRFEVK